MIVEWFVEATELQIAWLLKLRDPLLESGSRVVLKFTTYLKNLKNPQLEPLPAAPNLHLSGALRLKISGLEARRSSTTTLLSKNYVRHLSFRT